MKKRGLLYIVLLCYVFTLLPTSELSVLAAIDGTVTIEKDSESVTIGNEYINRTLSIKDRKLLTSSILNNRINKELKPSSGSNDFEIRVLADSTNQDKIPSIEIDRSLWSGTISKSDGTGVVDAAKLFDNNNTTDIDYYQGNAFPYLITIDLKEEKNFQSISFMKRVGSTNPAWGVNGTIGKYKLETSMDGLSWSDAGSGEFTSNDYNLHQEGNLYNTGDMVYANFDTPQKAQYVRISALSEALSTNKSFCMAEIRLYEDEYEKTVVGDDIIRSSDLTLASIDELSIDNGKELVVNFEPYNYKEVTWSLSYHIVMYNDEYFMRSFIKINADDKDKARIDYIEMDHFILDTNAEGVWSRPDDFHVPEGAYNFLAHEMLLGQPIYVNGLFFGSEFPATDTNIVDNIMKIRYYSGKNLQQLEDEERVSEGGFTSWPNVVGAAQGTDKNVVQTDFFAYIDTIATTTEFRKQYNSWYENRMGINDDSVQNIFFASEKGLSSNGVEPLDSYVVDDGWNNYNDPTYTGIDVNRSGNSYNRTGFWEFNDKFPNELYPSMEMTKKFNSTFGLWLGPQGGYELQRTFSQYLASKGTAYVHANAALGKVIDAGSYVYQDHLKDLFVDYQTRFDIDYWKLDGFASRPNVNADNNHMVGGDNNMYYTSELWENWIDIFEAMREQRSNEGKGLFINATCYINPSPWHLQWVNTVWQQNAGDLESDSSNGGSQSAKMISGRDNIYFVNGMIGEFQFPLKNVYNHEPIYGKAAGVSMTTNEFREYLVGNAVRGTAFWELYFSPSMMDDAKWKVTAEVLAFAQENHHILENAKLFGSSPKSKAGIYGYSSWNEDEGIVYFRNPTATVQSYTFDFNDVAGVSKTVHNLKQQQVYPYKNTMDSETVSYGDTISITLDPYELVVYQYGKKDSEKPNIETIKNTNNKTIQVRFNERVSDEFDVSTSSGTIKEINLLDDYQTATIEFDKELSDVVSLDLKYKDIEGNITEESKTITIYDNHVIANVNDKDSLKDSENMTIATLERSDISMLSIDNQSYELKNKNTYDGNGDFSLSFVMKSGSTNSVIYKQNDVEVGIDNEGYISATIGNNTFNSKEVVTKVVELEHGLRGTNEYVPTTTVNEVVGTVSDNQLHTVVVSKELNGLCKIYIDGKLRSSLYLPDEVLSQQDGTTITLGDSTFNGYIGNLEFRNESIAFDEAQSLYDELLLSGDAIVNRTGWKATASSSYEKNPTVEGPARLAIDGDTGTLWHTNWAAPYPNPLNHWIAIEFDGEESFDKIAYTGRTAGTNGNMKGYSIQIKDTNDNWVDVQTGEIEDGGTRIITLDSKVTTSAIRINVTSAYGPQSQHAAAVEINVLSSSEELADYTTFKASVDAIELKDKDKYTSESYATYKASYDNLIKGSLILDISKLKAEKLLSELEHAQSNLVEKAESLNIEVLETVIREAEAFDLSLYTLSSQTLLTDELEHAKTTVKQATTQVEIDKAVEDLRTAINQLELKESIDFSVLRQTITEAEKIKTDMYTSESVNDLTSAISSAKTLLDVATTQKEVDDAVDSINTAVNGLVLKNTDMNVDTLHELISKVEAMNLSDYTPESVTVLTEALTNAKHVLKHPTTQAEVNNAVQTLSDAINRLEEIASNEGVTYRTLISDDETIMISGYFHSDVELKVSEYTDVKAFTKSLRDNRNMVDTELLAAYNIELRRSGEIYKFDRPAKVDIKIPASMNGKVLTIIHIDELHEVNHIDSEVIDGYITFYTTHFSDYAITTPTNNQHPQTGDTTNITLYVCLFILASSGIIAVKKRRN